MAKAGDEYQSIVGAVAKALDPGAIVRVGVWMLGPDGRRDLDVEVRGSIDGKPHLIQIECKDWADPVGIAVVDALDSKRHDVAADHAIIYSNSGFTDPALRKAVRLGIGMASALKAGDRRINVAVHKQLVAKSLSVDSMKIVLHAPPGKKSQFSNGWSVGELMYERLPVQNWIAPLSKRLLTEHEHTGILLFACIFRPNGQWSYAGELVEIAAMQVFLTCSRSWVCQTVREDVTLGLYDHIRKVVTVPSQQGYYMGLIDQTAWQPLGHEPEEQELSPGSFSIDLTLLKPISPIDASGPPNLDDIVIEQAVTLEPAKQ
jgi:Restriction endonuclease